MNKKLLIVILIAIVLLVLGGVVLYVAFFSNKDAVDGGDDDLFPFLGQDRDPSPAEDAPEDLVTERGLLNILPLNTGVALQQVWNQPVSGATFTENGNGSSTVRFVERGTGHVYEILLETGVVNRLSNTTIPKVQEVFWASNDRIILRYLRDEEDIIETFAGTILFPKTLEATSTENVVGEISGQFLPTNILQLAVQNDGTLFYLTEGGGLTRGVVSSFDGSGAREVFSSPIRDWLVAWKDASTVALTSKAASGVGGDLLFLNITSGALSPVLSGVFGLTTSVEGPEILYARHNGVTPTLFLLEQDDDRTRPIVTNTLTEKCSWAQNTLDIFCAVPREIASASLPDSWYQGVTHFNDVVRVVDVGSDGLETETVFDPLDYTASPLDIINLSVYSGGEHILFTNKRDHTLWLFSEPKPEEAATSTPMS